MKLLIVFILTSFSSLIYSQSQIHLTDSNTGAQSWELKQDGVVLYLNQLLPDQVRAFYSNRGFTQSQIDSYAQSCVFMTVFRNESATGVIHYKTSDWRVQRNNKEYLIKPVDDWLNEYKAIAVKQSSLIGFRWAQFPIDQEYEPGGDWNQGMLSIGAFTAKVDVIAQWTLAGKSHSMTLKGISCAV